VREREKKKGRGGEKERERENSLSQVRPRERERKKNRETAGKRTVGIGSERENKRGKDEGRSMHCREFKRQRQREGEW